MSMSKHDRRCIRAYLAPLLVFVLSAGCGQSYKAPDLPLSEMAMLTTSSDELAILSVDGLPTPSLRLINRRQVALAPGEHVLVMRHSRSGSIAEASLTVTVQAGRRYVLKSASRGYLATFWIEEIPPETGPLV